MKNRYLDKIFFSKKGIRLLWGILAVIAFIFVGEILLVDPFGILLSKIGLSEVTGAIAQTWSDALGDSFKRLLRAGVVVISILLVVKYLFKKTTSFIGIDFRSNRYREMLLGIGLGFLVQIVSIVLMILMGWFEFKGFSWQYHSVSFFAPAILFTIIYCIETGIIEEVIFRGFLLNIFKDRYSTTIGVIVSSVMFGVVHFSGFEEEFAWWMSLISSLVTGFIFAQAFLLFRSLWLPFGFHAGWHLAMRVLGSVGLDNHEAIFMITEVKGPPMLVSTKAGGAGLFELIGVIIASLVMLFISKNLQNN